MSELKPKRLSAVARDLNVGISTIVKFLEGKGYDLNQDPNSKVPLECIELLEEEFKESKSIKEKAIQTNEKAKITKEKIIPSEKQTEIKHEIKEKPAEKETAENIEKQTQEELAESKNIEISMPNEVEAEKEKKEEKREEKQEDKVNDIELKSELLIDSSKKESKEQTGPKVVGKINLNEINDKTRPKRKTKAEKEAEYKKTKTKKTDKADNNPDNIPVETETVVSESKNEQTDDISVKHEQIDNNIKENINKQDAAKKVVKKVAPEEKEEENELDLDQIKAEETEKSAKLKAGNSKFIETKVEKLTGPNVVGKINLDSYLKQQEESEKRKKQLKEERQKQRDKEKEERKSKRKRIKKANIKIDPERIDTEKFGHDIKRKKPIKKVEKQFKKPEIDEEEVQKQIKETLARLTTPKQKSKTSKYRKEKREIIFQKHQEELEKAEAEKKILKVTEFVSVNELAAMMDVPVTKVIATCMSLGLFVSINQRLDAETMSIVADEYGYSVEFVSAEVLDEIEEIPDTPEDLVPRPPIVTVMGHVDHGKTKLLDQIRKTNVAEGEAGGITQHIGAYSVTLEDGRKITFLDTPGHEAFTAMRARGAQITDVAIIVIAADDNIMPQTVEAINHASAAGVPIVFAINKIDLPTAHPDKIREALANMNYLVEEWGGKYQCQEISAKVGINIDLLLEKVLLEAELLDLKANPNKKATGTVIESSLDKGRGYVATLIVQNGTLKVGDILLAGSQTGRVKAMYNERGQKLEKAEPSTPVLVLGLNGAPMAGDKFNVMDNDHEARALANKRQQLMREQELRTKKHITLDEIGRRLALGNFNEINIIVKGDVDGSVEALSDALIKLSTDNFVVNIIHKAVGQISESDVMLAAASNAIIVGFQVRPSNYARKLAEKEQIEIRLYSIIYDAINDMKDAMEGMLSPTIKENVTGSAEVKEIFKINKLGTVAGCLVTEGRIYRKSKVRVIRDGIVIYTGDLGSLKRFKDDAKEVVSGQECGLNIDKFNDVKVGDIIEAFEEVEVKQTL